MGLQKFDEILPLNQVASITNADGTVVKSLLSAGSTPRRIDHIYVSTNDTIAHVVDIQVTIAGNNFLLASATVPASSGIAGNPPVDLLAALLNGNLDGFALNAADTLTAHVEVAVSAGAFYLLVMAVGGQL